MLNIGVAIALAAASSGRGAGEGAAARGTDVAVSPSNEVERCGAVVDAIEAGACAVVLDATDEGLAFEPAAKRLAELRRVAEVIRLERGALDAVLDRLRASRPRYVAFVVAPVHIDDNFVGAVFEGITRLDDDPLLDASHGFITGASPEDALALVERTAEAEAEPRAIRRRFVAVAHTFAGGDLAPFAPQEQARYEGHGFETAGIISKDGSAAWEKAAAEELRALDGASLVYFVGHGMGDWQCAIAGRDFARVTLDHAVVVSGTCHSAVTLIRHDIRPETLDVTTVGIDPRSSICLNLIRAGAIAQIGSTASSSWMNVAGAIDGFFGAGLPIGDALREHLDARIAASGRAQVRVVRFEDGKPSPQFPSGGQPADPIQSLARVVLIGDPAYRPYPDPPETGAAPVSRWRQ